MSGANFYERQETHPLKAARARSSEHGFLNPKSSPNLTPNKGSDLERTYSGS